MVHLKSDKDIIGCYGKCPKCGKYNYISNKLKMCLECDLKGDL